MRGSAPGSGPRTMPGTERRGCRTAVRARRSGRGTTVSDEAARVAAVRRGVPATERLAYLNAGSHGPLTAAAGETIARLAQDELMEGRIGTFHLRRMRELRTAVRAEFARALGCDVAAVPASTSTTAGVNF